MKVHLVTFATDDMSRAADLCIESAKRHGAGLAIATRWDAIRNSWTYHGVNMELRAATRGPAYWSWKPFVIAETMKLLNDGDILIYSDAGVEFINNVSYIIDRMDQDIFLFGNNWEHAHWCKRDVIEEVWPHMTHDAKVIRYDYTQDVKAMCGVTLSPDQWQEMERFYWERLGKQVQASVIFFRVSDYTRAFVKEWLDWGLFEGGRLIDDSPSRLPNHPEFREHRHDQAILTTMAYREGIKIHWWGARYNMDRPGGGFVYPKAPEFAGDTYEPFVHHHRRRNHEWEQVA